MKIKQKTSKKRNILKKILKYFLYTFLSFFVIFIIYFFIAIKTKAPIINNKSCLNDKKIELGENFFGIKNNRIRKSETGLWELYVEGNPFEIGVYNGILAKDLIIKQENAFVEQIEKMIPSPSYLKFLKYFVGWFNRDMDKYIPKEYLTEIYGISHSASENYDFIGTNYHRILNYHGAHDIGHALQDLAMVGCTSFSVWNEFSTDSSLIIGRNFDFYMGEKFAEDKIVTFYNPEKGYKFAMISWGGFVGVVSGMNTKGITVTINAGKSDIPFSAKVPISLLAREILQYAKNIDEAYEIANKRDIFVSEALMIGSISDNKTVIIEKSPNKTALFDVKGNYIIGPNHFQSHKFEDEELNIKNIKESSSMYRYKRMKELLNKNKQINYLYASEILRNKEGINNKDIGLSNEKSICQLISHHSIIFKPNELKFWISTSPYQLGEYICYDLDSVFSKLPGMDFNQEIYEKEYTIPADTFLLSKKFLNLKKYRKLVNEIKSEIKNSENLSINSELIKDLIELNPEYYNSYCLSGDYCFEKKKYKNAEKYYTIALTKEITTIPEVKKIENRIKEIEKLKIN